MTKRYILSKEDLQNLIHASMAFFSEKAQECMKEGKVPMFSDRVKWIDEFLNQNLKEFPLDEVLENLDWAITSFTGKSIDELKNDIRKKCFTPEGIRKRQEEIKEFMDLKNN